MQLRLLLFFCLFFCLCTGNAQVTSPKNFLGYEPGERFTPHHRIVDYFRQLAAAAPTKMRLETYGETNEGRPLLAAFISSPRNIARLDAIRDNNLGLAQQGRSTGNLVDAPVIVWLSYNVHGNEPSSSEAAIKTAYELLQPTNSEAAKWLDNVVVVIDPCLNPDGRDRYVNWYNSVTGVKANALNAAREHSEPWPGGRVNHYYFDLNRDWAWQTQRESRARVQLYRQWLPQVHVDFHEQGVNNPYYFAPAAEPYHEVITPWQRQFQETIGRNHAKYFDRNGWLYFTKEVFDLFYPAYGDTYPLYNGSIGMTYEQAGGPGGGRAALMEGGDTLTLADRVAHHFTTGMSTIEVASREASALLKNYSDYFRNTISNGAGAYRTFLVKGNNNRESLQKLKALLQQNGIEISQPAPGKKTVRAYNYESRKEEPVTIAGDDIVLSTRQPQGALLRVLFDPNPKLADSVTYDITGWALPYVYGVTAFAIAESVAAQVVHDPIADKLPTPLVSDTYGYVVRWEGMKSASLLAKALQAGARIRFAEKPFRAGGKEFGRGSLLLLKAANRMDEESWAQLLALAQMNGAELQPVSSGFVDSGADFGSSSVHLVAAPKVALLSGEGTSSNAVGEVWHYFEQELNYPVTLINTTDFGRTDWSRFTVLILANGSYRFLNDKANAEALKNWVSKGGKLIALEGAVNQLAGLDWGLKARKAEEPADGGKVNYGLLRRYEDRERDEIPNFTPGSIYKVELDNSHPLAFGYGSTYYTLRQDDRSYEFLGDGWNVGVVKKEKPVAGFVGNKLQPRLQDALIFGVQDMGNGSVVYLTDDVLFRDFWENGKLLFANAVFLVGQ